MDHSTTTLTHPLPMGVLSKSCPKGPKTPTKATKQSVYGTEGRKFESSRARESNQALSSSSAGEIGQRQDKASAEAPDSAGFSIDENVGSRGKQKKGPICDHAARARRLMQAVASDRQDAWRMAEDLAMGVLMAKDERAHHAAARHVLKEPTFRIPRALELCIQLIGAEPKVSEKKRKAR